MALVVLVKSFIWDLSVADSVFLDLILGVFVKNFLILLHQEAIGCSDGDPINSWRFNWGHALDVSQRHSELDIGLDMLSLAFLLKLVSNFIIALHRLPVNIR